MVYTTASNMTQLIIIKDCLKQSILDSFFLLYSLYSPYHYAPFYVGLLCVSTRTVNLCMSYWWLKSLFIFLYIYDADQCPSIMDDWYDYDYYSWLCLILRLSNLTLSVISCHCWNMSKLTLTKWTKCLLTLVLEVACGWRLILWKNKIKKICCQYFVKKLSLC